MTNPSHLTLPWWFTPTAAPTGAAEYINLTTSEGGGEEAPNHTPSHVNTINGDAKDKSLPRNTKREPYSAIRKRPSSQSKKNNPTSIIQQAKAARRSKFKRNSPGLEVLTAHRQLDFWKNKLFNQLNIKSALDLAMASATAFDKNKITTVVPNRYLFPPTLPSAEFPGVLKIDSAMKAIERAYRENMAENLDTHRLVLWTDGSGSLGGRQGLAVAWRHSETGQWGPWKAEGYKAIGGIAVTSDAMEYLAVIKAFDLACSMVEKDSKPFKTVVIYTDATSVIESLRHRAPTKALALHIVKRAMKLIELGIVDLSIHWVPGHSKVMYFISTGMVTAHRLTGTGARQRIGRQSRKLCWFSLLQT